MGWNLELRVDVVERCPPDLDPDELVVVVGVASLLGRKLLHQQRVGVLDVDGLRHGVGGVGGVAVLADRVGVGDDGAVGGLHELRLDDAILERDRDVRAVGLTDRAHRERATACGSVVLQHACREGVRRVGVQRVEHVGDCDRLSRVAVVGGSLSGL